MTNEPLYLFLSQILFRLLKKRDAREFRGERDEAAARLHSAGVYMYMSVTTLLRDFRYKIFIIVV